MGRCFRSLRGIVGKGCSGRFVKVLVCLSGPLSFTSERFSIVSKRRQLAAAFLVLCTVGRLVLRGNVRRRTGELSTRFLAGRCIPSGLGFGLGPLITSSRMCGRVMGGR